MATKLLYFALVFTALILLFIADHMLFEQAGEGSNAWFRLISVASVMTTVAIVSLAVILLWRARETQTSLMKSWRALKDASSEERSGLLRLRILGAASESLRGRRGIQRVLGAAVIGCCFCTAISWVLALTSELDKSPGTSPAFEAWVTAQEATGRRRASSSAEVWDNGCRIWHFLSWPDPNTHFERAAFRIDCGWPIHCLTSTVVLDVSADGVSRPGLGWAATWFEHGIRLPRSLVGGRYAYGRQYDRYLPAKALVGGFIVNSLFFGTWVLFVPLFAATVRWNLRLDAGLCPRCGYPRDHSRTPVCSECNFRG